MQSKILLPFYALLVIGVLIWSSSSNGRATQAGQGNCGAPCEGGTLCGNCHSSGAFGSVNETLTFIDQTTNMATTQYIPGRTYDVSVTINFSSGSPSEYGFQACSLTGTNSDIGTWQNLASNVKSALLSNYAGCGDRTYVEHNQVSTSNVFSMEWVAPSTDVGDITFYYAGIAANNAGGSSGDTGGFGNSTTITPTCAPTLAVNGTIANGTYEATLNINSDGTVPPGFNVDFVSGDNIDLLPDFEVINGAQFSATIDPNACN